MSSVGKERIVIQDQLSINIFLHKYRIAVLFWSKKCFCVKGSAYFCSKESMGKYTKENGG
jgi:hypothetical protein